ncbi:MAG: sulfurtransferase TusA family protein [Candidatus Micrarchaeia archaeon]
MARVVIDARGSSCPGPIVELSKAYRNAKIGDVIELWATDQGVKSDVNAWAQKTKNKIDSITEQSDKIIVVIEILNR